MAIDWKKVKKNAKKIDKADTIRNLHAEAVDRNIAIDNAASEGRNISKDFAEKTKWVTNAYGKTLNDNKSFVKKTYGTDTYKQMYQAYTNMKKSNATDFYTKYGANTTGADWWSNTYDARQAKLDTRKREERIPFWKTAAKRVGEGALSLLAAFGGGDVNDIRQTFNNSETKKELEERASKISAITNEQRALYESRYRELLATDSKLRTAVADAAQEKQKAKQQRSAIRSVTSDVPDLSFISEAAPETSVNYINAVNKIEKMGYSKEEAEDLINMYEIDRDAKLQEEMAKANAQAGYKAPLLSVAPYVAANALQVAAIPEIVAGAANEYLGDRYRPLNTNTAAFAATNYRENVSQGAQQRIEEEVKLKGGNEQAAQTARFLYQTGMSIADFLAVGKTFGAVSEGVSLAIMGTGAAVTTAKQATDRGLGATEAAATALMAGMAEVAFEKISLDKFIKMGNPAKMSARIVNVLKQSGIEGSEEFFTDVANAMTDYLINANHSELMQQRELYIADLMKKGLSREEAMQRANDMISSDFGKQLVESFFGGAISGGVTGSVQSMINRATVQSKGKEIRGDVDFINSLQDVVNQLPANSESSKLSKEISKSKNVSDARLGELYYSTLNDIEKEYSKAKTLKELNNITYAITDAIDETRLEGMNGQFTRDIGALYVDAVKNIKETEKQSDSKPQEENKTTNDAIPEIKTDVPEAVNNKTTSSRFNVGATIKTSGTPVTLTSVAKADGLGLWFNTEKGKQVGFGSVNFDNPIDDKIASEAVEFYDEVALGTEGANAFVSGMTAKVNSGTGVMSPETAVNTYSQAAKIIYNIGVNNANLPFSKITNNRAVESLGADFARAMFEAGKADAKADTEAKEKAKGEKTINKAGSGKFANEIDDKGLNVIGSTLASTAKTDTYIRSGISFNGTNGEFNVNTDEVDVFASSSRGVVPTLIHENVMEFIRKYNEKGHNKLVEAASEYIAEQIGWRELAKWDSIYYNKYSEVQKNTTRQDAQAERTNDFFAALISANKHAQQRFAKWLEERGDSKLINEIKDFVKSIIDTLNKYTNSDAFKPAERAAINADKESANRLMDLLEQAYDDAVKAKAELDEMKSQHDKAFPNSTSAQTEKMLRDSGFAENEAMVSDGKVVMNHSLMTIEESRKKLRSFFATNKENAGNADVIIGWLEEVERASRGVDGEKFQDWNIIQNAEPRSYITKNGSIKYIDSWIVNNGEYVLNCDSTTLCKKRIPFDKILYRLAKEYGENYERLPKTAFTAIKEILREEGIEVACDNCFVDSKRYNVLTWASRFTDNWNDLVRSLTTDRQSEAAYISLFEGVIEGEPKNALQTLTKEQRNDLENYINLDKINEILNDDELKSKAIGSMAAKLKENILNGDGSMAVMLHAGQITFAEGVTALRTINSGLFELVNASGGSSKPKLSISRGIYHSEILEDKRFNAEAAYRVGGVRVQSFSDYIASMFVDYCQLFADMAAKGLPCHAYTKELVFAEMFGLTGAKINLSLMPEIKQSDIDFINKYFEIEVTYKTDEDGVEVEDKTNVKVKQSYLEEWKKNYEARVAKEEAAFRAKSTLNKTQTTKAWNEYKAKNGMIRSDWATSAHKKELLAKFDAIKETAGLDENGEYLWARETVGYYEAKKLLGENATEKEIREKAFELAVELQNRMGYTSNVGTILVGISDAHIRKALADDRIRMVIPYHKSGINPAVAMLTGIIGNNDYTDQQNTRYTTEAGNLVKVEVGSDGYYKDITDKNGNKVKAFDDYEYLLSHPEADARDAADAYLKHCEEYGLTPKFEQFAYDEDENVRRNYYKLLEDYNSFDNKTEANARQGAVEMKLPDNWQDILNESLENQQESDAKFSENEDRIFNRIVKRIGLAQVPTSVQYQGKAFNGNYKGIAPSLENSKLSIDIDNEYMKAAENGDEAEAQKLVDDAAMRWGAYSVDGKTPLHLYHGTSSGGFTELSFAALKAKDSQNKFFNMWLTSDEPTAASYAYGATTRRLSEYNENVETESDEVGYYERLDELDNVRRDIADDIASFVSRNMGYYNYLESNYIIDRLDNSAEDAYEILDDIWWNFISDMYVGAKEYAEQNDEDFEYDDVAEYEDSDEGYKLLQEFESLSSSLATADHNYKEWEENGENISKEDALYETYAKLDNPLVVDANGKYWNSLGYVPTGELRTDIDVTDYDVRQNEFNRWEVYQISTDKNVRVGDFGYYPTKEEAEKALNDLLVLKLNRTRRVVEWAHDNGYDGVIFKNIIDDGGRGIEKVGVADYIVVPFKEQNIKSADAITYDDEGNVIPLSERFSESNDIRYSLEIGEPVEPTSDKWERTLTFDELIARFPNAYNIEADENETRNPTQIKGTERTYRRIYNILKDENFNGTILDASSGLGYGTAVGRSEFGFDVEDVEPYPDKSYSPMYTDYEKINKKYDVIISNAVLNVVTQDIRDALVKRMGELLKPNGRMFINTRGDDVNTLASNKNNTHIGNMEWYVANTGSYQKGFTKDELAAYVQDVLGDGFTVQKTSSFGGKATIIVTKANDTRYSIDIDADDSSDFIKSRKSLQNTVAFYKDAVQYLTTNKTSEAEIQKQAVALKKQYNSAMTVDEIKGELRGIYDYLASGNVTYEEYRDRAMTLGKSLVETDNAVPNEASEEILNSLKAYNVSITEEQRDNIAKYYGNVASWLNTVRKGVGYSTTANSLESQWGTLCEQFPDLFSENTPTRDMPLVLADNIRALTDTSTNEYGYDTNEMAEMFALDTLDNYLSKGASVKITDKETREKYIKDKASNSKRLIRIKADAKNKQSRKFEDLKKTNRRLVTENVDLANKLAKQKGKMQEQKDTRERSILRTRIRKNLNKILTMAATPTKDKHIPNSIIESVKSLAEAVTLDGTQYDERLLNKLANFSQGFIELPKNDSQYAIISEVYNGYIREKIDQLNRDYGKTPLKELPADALREINELIVMTGQSINNINRLFKKDRMATISGAANSIMAELEPQKKDKIYKGTLKGFMFDMMKPIYFFEHINSKTLTDFYQDLRDGEDTWILNYTKARDYMVDLRKKVGYNQWDFKDKQRFETLDGNVNLTLQQRMAIYANSIGEHTRKNLLGGGFTINEKNTTLKEKAKNKLKSNNENGTYQLTEDLLMEIIDSLTDEQIKYVKDMVNFMSTTCAEWGNEVTRQLYGVELYKENTYYPALIEGMYRFNGNTEKNQMGYKPQKELVNKSFTKSIIPEATNPLVLEDFEDTVGNHIIDMASYNAFVLPLENFDRVFNFNTVDENVKWDSVKKYIMNAYGDKATKYIDDLIADINGGAMASTDYSNKMVSLFKKGAVFASASVVAQQPSAIGRALAVIDAKYFIGNPVQGFSKKLYDEMLEYCPIARIKELGYFDTGMAQSAVSSLNAKEYDGAKDKTKAFFSITDSTFRDDVLSRPAAKADEITWAHIWQACKNEAADKYGNLSEEEQKQKAAERFKEVITKTQVYDSVFSRAAVMRNKNPIMKMATAFMAEPITSINMLFNAVTQAKRGNISKAKGARILGSLVVASIINSVLQSLVTAARHDKDDDDWKERYLAELLPNFIDNMNPANQVPFVRDAISLYKGYDVTRADMSVFKDTVDALKNLEKDTLTLDKKITGLAGALAAWLGLPVKNVTRDAYAVANIIKDMTDDYHFSQDKTFKLFKEEMNSSTIIKFFKEKDELVDAMYKASIEGDNKKAAKYHDQLTRDGVKDSYIDSKLKDRLIKEKDIAEAARDYTEGNLDAYVDVVEKYSANFEETLVTAAIRKIVNANAEEEDSEGSKNHNPYQWKDIYAAIDNDQDRALKTMHDAYVFAARVDKGKSEEDAEKAFTQNLKSHYKAIYKETQDQAIKQKLVGTGYVTEDDLAKWDKKEGSSGGTYDEMNKAFEGGLSATRQYVADRIKQKGEEGMPQDAAIFGLKTSIANAYKKKYIQGDANTRAQIITYMTNTGVYGDRNAVRYYIDKHWL